MKILAIRGSNLASLAGEFEIDLARGPLADAGVFAIIGNTGAGKSTLLDALCVALFDRTPRLTNHSRVIVGRGDHDPGTLGAHDVRTLLRRGAAGGYAEVDFESGDARRYRARWAVRRARDKSDGTLQDQTLSLIALDSSERLGGTKTETLKAISSRLGLSFDQFRRSALLAQGEFAAFLRAEGKDRSELLERMTGTEIYSRLSIAAHQRAVAAEQHLRDIRAAATAIAVLDDGARAAALTANQLAGEARRAARQRLDVAESAARWLAELVARTSARDAARADHAAAVAEAGDAEPVRAELALRRRLARLRAPLETMLRLEPELAGCRNQLDHANQTIEALALARDGLAARERAIAELLAPIRSARNASGFLEVQDVPRGTHGSAEPDNRTTARSEVDAVEAGRAAIPAAEWLVARIGLVPEIAAWPAVGVRFEEHASLGSSIGGLDRTLATLGADRAARLASRALAAADHRGAVEALAEQERVVQNFHDRRGIAPDVARRLEDEARQRTSDAETLVALAEGARAGRDLLELVARRCAELDRETATAAERTRELASSLEQARLLRAEREHVLDELRRAAGMTHARAELVDGEPCPLCGALEHPWRDRGALDDVVAAAEARRGEIVAAIGEIERDQAALAASAAQRRRDRLAFEGRGEVAATAIEAAATEWRGLLATLGELVFDADPTTPAAEQLAADRLAAARKQLEAARDTRHQTEAAAKAAADAHARVQLARASVDQLAARLAEIDRAIAELDKSLQRQRGERGARAHRWEELGRDLAEVAVRWSAIESGAATRHGSGAPVAGAPVAADLDDPRAWMAALHAEWHERGQRVQLAEAHLATAQHAIGREHRELESALASERARSAELAKRRVGLADELASARASFDGVRTEIGVTDAELATLLPAGQLATSRSFHELARALADEARIEALTAQLAALDQRLLRTRAIAGEREQLALDHERSRPEAVVLEDARTIGHLVSALAAAETEAARAAAVITADDDARVRRDQAFDMLAADEQRVEIDRVLGRVIGSHDGKLFRSFAQSLTLDGLLAVANAHLDELAPRYQLERIPRHDLEIQVIDRDLGDDVRSVQSLSGGEAFLVSLALALGLSSMSAHDVRVRTLLIDEGFGTLDPATLDAALATLDALQATGRQIGVISHVPALVERVGAHVKVVQRGGGRSDVVVRG